MRFLYGRPLETLLATFGVSLILQQVVRDVFTANNRPVETPAWMSGSLQINEALSITYNRLYVVIFMLIVFTVLLKKSYKASSFVAQLVLLTVVLVSTAVGEWVIASRMRELRTAMAIPIEQVSAGDPMRVAFQALHGYSVGALSIAIIAALIAFIFMTQRRAA